MEATRRRAIRDGLLQSAGILVALALSAVVLLGMGVSPWEAAARLLGGAFSSPGDIASVLRTWAPVLLCSAGLLLTFSAGMWNIGIEGQVVMGAVCTTGALRLLQGVLPPWAALLLSALAGLVGGALWGALAGALRLYGNVNEIFGGLGLNFIANGLTVYLVLGPWGRPGSASTSGTEPFPRALWLPAFPGFDVSPYEVALGLLAIAAVAIVLRGTYFGLRLKAIGQSLRAAFLLGVPTASHLMAAFFFCGACGGLAGWVLVVGASTRHQLYPLISGGYGFLGVLVVMLANRRAGWVLPISFFFAAIAMGSVGLDSSLAGVIQGLLVLGVLFSQGLQRRYLVREEGS
jgi:simple sugar transport system permease protein